MTIHDLTPEARAAVADWLRGIAREYADGTREHDFDVAVLQAVAAEAEDLAAPAQRREQVPRTGDDERRDVLAHLRAKLASYARTFRGMPADIAHGAHVGTAERAREELQAAGVTGPEAEHQRLADAAERPVASLDPDYVGDLADALDVLEVALRDRVRHMDLGAVARST